MNWQHLPKFGPKVMLEPTSSIGLITCKHFFKYWDIITHLPQQFHKYYYIPRVTFNVVAVSDTYRDDISDGYSIRDMIYSGQYHILG